MTERTPTPYSLEWEEEFDTFHHGVIGRYPAGVKGANNCWVVRFDDDYGTNQALDGEFIVRAANSHEELLAAGEGLADIILSLLEGREHSDRQLEELRDSWLAARLGAKAERGES